MTNPLHPVLANANLANVYWNLAAPELYEAAIRNGEGRIAEMGPLVTSTGRNTGRSPNDKFIVQEPTSQDNVWWGTVNRPLAEDKFDALLARMQAYLANRSVYVQQCFVGADKQYRVPLQVVTEFAWHNLFARNMFIRPTAAELANHQAEFTIIDIPSFQADPAIDGTRTGTFIIINFAKKMVLIGGTEYAGEIKKAAFTLLNYLMPLRGVMSMHCSANYGQTPEDAALFFGLSGTGKTTLSADPNRTLIGDDEHGWSNTGVFNYEGGCYAKVIKLSAEGEPEIYQTTRRFGTVLENVVMDEHTRALNLDDQSRTENTRSAYPITHIANADADGLCGHPKNVIFLTADAFGVLPPVAKLTTEQAMYHFISGYTAKVAGTEAGVTEPQATFSACFGGPFMVLHPVVYAKLLADKLATHKANVWLVNTGWTGGGYGVGTRMKLAHTRAMITAILNGQLANVPTTTDPFFGLAVPQQVPGVPAEVLQPRQTWASPAAYDEKAAMVAGLFEKNFTKYADRASEIKLMGLPVASR
jgi:phosphoenolpyruvate carboxykinase (ATP)